MNNLWFSTIPVMASVCTSIRLLLNINPFTATFTAPTLKPNQQSLKFEILKNLFFSFALEFESIFLNLFIKMHSSESRFIIRSENILFASTHIGTFQPGHFTGWGSEGVNPCR